MLLIPQYQKELIKNIPDLTISQILTLTELKLTRSTLKCFISNKTELYQKTLKGDQEVLLQAMKGIFSSNISHSQLCLDLVLSVFL